MKKIQITKHTFAAIGRRMLHKLSHQLAPNASTLVIVALLLFAYHAWAAPSAAPQVAPASQVNTGMLSYQGYLTDASGEPLTGDVDITFRLYDAPSGGAALWTEAHTGQNAVPVDDGLFNVMLGSLTPISSTVWSSGASYLGVQVGDDAEMSPREIVGNVPTALSVPDGAIGTDQIADGVITQADAPFAPLTYWYSIDDTADPNMKVAVSTHVFNLEGENDKEIDISAYGFTSKPLGVCEISDTSVTVKSYFCAYSWDGSSKDTAHLRFYRYDGESTGPSRNLRITLFLMGE
jgi:hypothetical protein